MSKKIEKTAESSIMESIDKLVSNSFLMLLFECVMTKSHPLARLAMKEKSVKGISDYIEQIILNLRHIIDEGGAEKEFHLRKAMQMKEMLVDIYGVIKIYLSVCNIIDLYIEEGELSSGRDKSKRMPDKLCASREADIKDVSAVMLKSLVKSKIKTLMEEASKYDAEEACSAILLTVLPNFFSDKELADYTAYSCKFYYENAPKAKAEAHVKQIMRCFAPQKTDEFGRHYPKEAEKLLTIFEQVRTADSENAAEHKKIITAYNRIYDKIDGIAEIISGLYTELTYITMMLSSMFTFDDIIKNNAVYIDFYKKTEEFLTGGIKDEFISEAFLGSLENMIEQEIVCLNDLARRKEILYKNVDFQKFSENTKTLFSMEFFMTTAFFENIDDAEEDRAANAESKQFSDFKSTQKELKALKLFIQENCLGMNERLKKAARRNLFLNVPLVSNFSKSRLLSYIDMMCQKTQRVEEIEDILTALDAIIEDDIFRKLSVY